MTMTAAQLPPVAQPAAPAILRRWHRRYYIQRLLVDHYRATIQKNLAGRSGLTLIDFGCGDMPYRALFAPQVSRYIAADLPGNPAATALITAEGRLNLPDASADLVLSSQVLEHVADPALYLSECSRVLKSGGRLFLSTHGSWWYHPHPTDYWRWTGQGLQKTLRDAGFDQVELVGLMGLAAGGIYLFQDGVFRHLPRFLRSPFYLFTQAAAALADRLHTDEDRRRDAAVYLTYSIKPDASCE